MPSCWFRVQFPTSRLDFLNHQAFWASQRRDILLLRREKTLQSDALRWVPIVIQLHWFLCFWFPSSFVQGCYRVKRLGGYSALRIARNLPEGGKLLSVEKDSLWVISHWVYLSLLKFTSKIQWMWGWALCCHRNEDHRVCRFGRQGRPGLQAARQSHPATLFPHAGEDLDGNSALWDCQHYQQAASAMSARSAFLCGLCQRCRLVIQVWWCVQVGTGTCWLCSSWPLQGGLVEILRHGTLFDILRPCMTISQSAIARL